MYLQTPTNSRNEEVGEYKSIFFEDKVSSAVASRHSHEKLNIMVVGPHSSGKTTLLQTICNSFQSLEFANSDKPNSESQAARPKSVMGYYKNNGKMPTPPKEGNVTSFLFNKSARASSSIPIELSSESQQQQQQQKTKEDYLCLFDATKTTSHIVKHSLIINISDNLLFESDQNKFIELSLIDTPGFDPNDIEDVKEKTGLISKYIKSLIEYEINEELNLFRRLSKSSDLLHAVIYVMKMPHNSNDKPTDYISFNAFQPSDLLSKSDEYIISKLSAITNVIPVIGKSDILNTFERNILQKGMFYDQIKKFYPKMKLYNLLGTQIETKSDEDFSGSDLPQIKDIYKTKAPLFLSASEHIYEYQVSSKIKQKSKLMKVYQDKLKDIESFKLANSVYKNLSINELQNSLEFDLINKPNKYSRPKKNAVADLSKIITKLESQNVTSLPLSLSPLSPLPLASSSPSLSPSPSPSPLPSSLHPSVSLHSLLVENRNSTRNTEQKRNSGSYSNRVMYQKLKPSDEDYMVYTQNRNQNQGQGKRYSHSYNYRLQPNSEKFIITRAGTEVPVYFSRRFLWGEMNVANPEHCDMSLFMKLVFSSRRSQLVENVRTNIYEDYRSKYILKHIQK